MPSIWEHYAQANDDIRHQLIDRGWFQDRMARNGAMEQDVDANGWRREPPETPKLEELYGTVQSQDPDMPEALQQSGMNEGTDQNPEAMKDAIEAFYGLKSQPQGSELGQRFEEERQLAQQEDALSQRP